MSEQVDIEFTSSISDELHEKLNEMLKDAGVVVEEHEENYYACTSDPCSVVDSWASEFELSFRLLIYTSSGGGELQYMFGKLLDEMVDFDECYRIDSEDGHRELHKIYPKGALCSFKEHSTVLYLIRVNGAGTWRFDREVDHVGYPISEKFLSTNLNMGEKKLMTQSNVDLIKAFGVNVCDGISPLPFTLMKSILSVDKSERNRKRLGKLVSNYLRLSPNTSDKDKQAGALVFNKNTLGIYKVLKRDGWVILETVYHPNMELTGREFKQLLVNNYYKIPSGLEAGVYQLIFNDFNTTSLPVEDTEEQNETTESTPKESEFKQLDELVNIFCSNHNKLKYKAFTDKTKQMIVDVLPIDVDDLMLDAVITAVMNGTNAHYSISNKSYSTCRGYRVYTLHNSTKYIYERTENSEFKGVKIMTIDKFKSIIDSVEKPEEKTSPAPDVSEYHVDVSVPEAVVIDDTLKKIQEASRQGDVIEYKVKNKGKKWRVKKNALWFKNCDYRIAQIPKTLEVGQQWKVIKEGVFVNVFLNIGDVVSLITDQNWERTNDDAIYSYGGNSSRDYYKELSDIAHLTTDVPISKTLTELVRVKEAYKHGAEIEACYGTVWHDVSMPLWLGGTRYRVKFTEPIGASKTDDSCTTVTEIVKKQDDLIDPKYNGIYKSKVASNKFMIRAGKLITGNVSDSFDANSIIDIFLADNYDTECWIGSTWVVAPLKGEEPNLVTLTTKKDRHKSVHSIDVSNRYEASSETPKPIKEILPSVGINPIPSAITEKPEVTFSDTVDKYVARRRRRRT